MEDTRKVGLLKSGSYFMLKAKPGKHTYWAETETKEFVTIDVQPQKFHYIIGGVDMGFWAGRPKLDEVTPPIARQLIPELEYTILCSPEETKARKKAARNKAPY